MDYSGKKEPKPQTEEGISEVSWKDRTEIKKQVLGHTFRNIELMLNEYWEATAQ